MRGTFSLVGFIVGAVCALVLFIVATAIAQFRHEDLVFGLLALLLWLYLSFNWPGGRRVA